MTFLKDTIDNLLGKISAMQTLLNRYPQLLKISTDLTNEGSLDILFYILQLLGVSEKELIDWFSKLLADKEAKINDKLLSAQDNGMPSGNGSDGLLTVIEYAVKAAILASLKTTYTCSMNLILPDEFMYSLSDSHYDPTLIPSLPFIRGGGVKIDLDQIDMFGTLNNCPTDKTGSLFYFDSAGKFETASGGTIDFGYNPTNVWTSTDFNAFLWYVINKGVFKGGDLSHRLKCTWDNRGRYRSKWIKEGCLRGDYSFDSSKEKFMSKYYPNSPTIIFDKKFPKKQILICSYEENAFSENDSNIKGSNILRVWLNSDRYYRKGIPYIESQGTSANFVTQNKTIFEFNIDYLSSLKLFDSKTLVAQIINSILGITTSLSGSFSLKKNIIAEKVSGIVTKVLQSEDEITTDCYYTFSNDEYNTMLENATNKYNGEYNSGSVNGGNIKVNTDNIVESLYQIDTATNLVEETNNISRTFTEVISALTVTQEAETQTNLDFTFGLNIVYKLIGETITQVIMQVLSPKILILYAINNKVMDPESKGISSLEDFIKSFQNLISYLIKTIAKIIIQQILEYVIGKLMEIIELWLQKILLEALMFYRQILDDIIKNYGEEIIQVTKIVKYATATAKSLINLINGTTSNLTISNVNYADIIPSDLPESDDCK